jgi:hypothetical protein
VRKSLAVALLAATIVVWPLAKPASATSPPAYTNSEYLQTLNTSTNYNDGCAYGLGDVSGVHILAVGRVAYDSSSDSFGTISPSGGFWSNSSIIAAAEAWAQGWHSCSSTTPQLFVAVGVNDSYQLGTCSGCGYKLPATHSLPGGGTGSGSKAAGAYFGNWINTFESYLVTTGYDSQEAAAGAFDAEPAWDSDPGWASHTAVFDSAYNANINLLFDFGSAEMGYITLSELYAVAYGEPDNVNLPEFYYGVETGTIQDWINGNGSGQGLDQWAYTNGDSFQITGVNDDYNTSLGCTLTPSTDWNDALDTIQDDSSVYYQSSITWLTNFGVLC